MSLIIDAIKRAQQLRLKELKGVPFFRGYGPKGQKGEPRRKVLLLLSVGGSAILLILLLLLWGDTFLSLFTPSEGQISTLVDQRKTSELPVRERSAQEVSPQETPTVGIKKKLPPEALFIDIMKEPPFEEKSRKKEKETVALKSSAEALGGESLVEEPTKKKRKKKAEIVTEVETVKRETLSSDPAVPLAQKASPSSQQEEVISKMMNLEKESEKKQPLPSEALTHFNRGVDLYRKRETLKAAQAYQKVIELDPTYIEAYNNLGIIYQEIGNFDKALEVYQKAIDINPRYEKTFNNLGILLFLDNRYEESIEAFQKALAINPNNIESHINLGILYKRRGMVDKAIVSYQKAISINPLNGETHYNIGLLYEQLENFDLAIDHFQTFVQLSSKTHPDLVSKVLKHLNYLLRIKKDKGK